MHLHVIGNQEAGPLEGNSLVGTVLSTIYNPAYRTYGQPGQMCTRTYGTRSSVYLDIRPGLMSEYQQNCYLSLLF